MDEPTSALSTAEVDQLFQFIERLKGEGIAVLYVSHKMDEIRRIADTVTILRDGAHVVTRPLEGMSLEEIIEHIVGRRVNAFAHRARNVERSGPPLLQVRGPSGAEKPRDVTFDLHAGEILGVGRSELARVIAGLDPAVAGEVRVRGKAVPRQASPAVIAAGVALIPEDRRTQGLILEHSIAANTTCRRLTGSPMPASSTSAGCGSRSSSRSRSCGSRLAPPRCRCGRSRGETSRRWCWPSGWRPGRTC